MHGERDGSAAHWRTASVPSSLTQTASPGSTSRRNSNPTALSATLSEATMYSVPSGPSREPRASGRIPRGSRNATSPNPNTRATAAYPPTQRRCTPETARKMSSSPMHGEPEACSSCANTLSSTSESESVFR